MECSIFLNTGVFHEWTVVLQQHIVDSSLLSNDANRSSLSLLFTIVVKGAR